MSAGFKDHFSSGSSGYAAYRPSYPAALFEWLASQCPSHDLAWDCATGNGQAAVGLAKHFRRIIATDASDAQLEQAQPVPNIEYRIAPAEASGLVAGSVDMVTVAQALHWFDRPRFFAEAGRVGKPGGLLACWMYGVMFIDPAFDRVIDRLYTEIVGPYWPGDRVLVDQKYGTIRIPFEEIDPPPFEMGADWTLDHVLGYLRTWSAVIRYQAALGEDPVALVKPELAAAWGERGTPRRVRWPLTVRVARIG